jgi:hypothetical protein
MRPKCILAAVAILLLPLAACQPELALHPWYNEKDLVLEPGFSGEWLSIDSDGKPDTDSVFTFAQDIAVGYTVSLHDTATPDLQSSWEARLFRVNGQLFIDGVQQLTKYKGQDTIELFVPGHFVGRVKLDGDRLSVKCLDDEWTAKALNANPALIKHEMIDKDSAVLLAPTAELREFALAHAGDEKAFSANLDFVRKK